MKWQKGRESDNVVEDRGRDVGNGGGYQLPFRGFHLSIGSILGIVVLSLIFGINPLQVLGFLSDPSTGSIAQSGQSTSSVTSNEPEVKFVRVILGSTEDVWSSYFSELGKKYEAPKLDIFSGSTRSACGLASEASGPFYCTSDQMVYLDLSFFQDMQTKLHAGGEFARAYVIAHEIGHHVQNLLGITSKMDRARNSGERMEGAQGLSVRLELQADCFAGVWANRSEKQLSWLQQGDIESALNAANQIGDDMLERKSRGFVVPDSFTHGTSAQRVHWFKTGFSTGNIDSCDTFSF